MSLLGSLLTLGGMIIGGALGSLIPGIGTSAGIAVGSMIGSAIGGYVGSVLFPDKINPNSPPPPKPRENRVQISTYAAPIPIVYESARISGNVIYMQTPNVTLVMSKHRQDGVRYYEYVQTTTSTFAVAFCEGPVSGISRIWVNSEIFADFRDPAGEYYPTGSVTYAVTNFETSIELEAIYFTIYTGTETQVYDPDIAAILGAAETPAYRGICYVVFKDFPIGEFSGLPKIEVEIGPQMESSECSEYFNYSDGALDSSIFTCPDTPGWVGDKPFIDNNRLKSYTGVESEITDRYLIGTYQFLGEFDYYTEIEIDGSDYTYHSLYIAPDGSLEWKIFIETPSSGVGRYEVNSDEVYDEYLLAAPATNAKLRLRRDSSDNIYAYYWNYDLSRWEWNGDVNGILLGTMSGAIAPAFDMRTEGMTSLYVNDFIVTEGCSNTESFVFE